MQLRKFLKVNCKWLKDSFKDSRIHRKTEETYAAYDKQYKYEKVLECLIRLRVSKDHEFETFSHD